MSVIISILSEKNSISMPRPHSHNYYELYFLLEGVRTVFVENKLFTIEKNSFVIIPPFTMHKTEGGPFIRVNINVSANLLSDTEITFLTNSYKKTAFEIGKRHLDIIVKILTDVSEAALEGAKDRDLYMMSATHLILLLLSKQANRPILPLGATHGETESLDVLKIIRYLNENYKSQITLKELCDVFYMSQTTLCKKFKSIMSVSIMDYLLEIRLRHSQQLLKETHYSIDFIAQSCGFSSTNYFRNVFKKAIGYSPLKYRKSTN